MEVITVQILRKIFSPRREKELENMKADIEQQKEQLETPKLTMQYVALMNDIYIPGEEDNGDVRNTEENEE